MKKDYLELEIKKEIKNFKKERASLLKEINKIEKEINFFLKQKDFLTKIWKQKFFPKRKRKLGQLKNTLENTEKKLQENQFFENFFNFNNQLS